MVILSNQYGKHLQKRDGKLFKMWEEATIELNWFIKHKSKPLVIYQIEIKNMFFFQLKTGFVTSN